MLERRTPRGALLRYLVPILVGMSGILFATQLEDVLIRALVVLLSVSIPVFASGTLLGRTQTSRLERVLLAAGVLMLLAGAGVTVSGLSSGLVELEMVSEAVGAYSNMLGLFSLMLGLFVVLYSVVRSGEDVQEFAQRFWRLADQISEGFVLSASDGTIVLVNQRFLDMTGLTEDQVIGQNAAELARRLDIDPLIPHIESRQRGIASEYEVTYRVRGEDRVFWFNGTPLFDRQQRQTGVLATVRDVTEFHRLSQRVERYAQGLQQLVEEQTEKLRRSEERFRELLLSMNEGFLTLDAGHRIRFANERICALLRVGRDSIIGREIFDFVDAPGRIHLMNLLARGNALERGESRSELNLVNTAGDSIPVVTAIAYVGEDLAADTKYSLVVTSVRELKDMQHELESRARELERVNEELRMHDRAKDSFLSNVSHELRTPLSTIQGYVEMLESGNLGALDEPQLGAIKVMRRNVNRLIGHINEIIEFSRMEIRGLQLNVTLFTPERLVREAVASVHPQTLAKELSVTVSEGEQTPLAWGDREKLGQVLGILLNNAIKFTDAGGLIQVTLTAREDRTLRLTVADTGIGIPQKYHEQVFTKFFQVDSSRTRRYEGTGIGLSIARSIVEAHGGRILLDSTPGQGSTFTVELPGAVLDSAFDPGAVEGWRGATLLLAEERPILKKALAPLFEAAEAEVHETRGGFGAVRDAARLKPGIILLNDSPSDLAGENTLTHLRQHAETSGVPVVVISAEGAARLQENMARWPGVSYVPKPFGCAVLAEALRRAALGEQVNAAAAGPDEAGDARPRLLVVDSDPGLLDWLETALGMHDIICLCATSARDAVARVRDERPDAVFLDVDLPEADAREAVKTIRESETLRGAPLFLMTGLPRDLPVAANGAGILRKPFEPEEIAGVAKAVVNGGRGRAGGAHKPASGA